MAGQNLSDQGRSRPGHAQYEDRLPGRVACTGEAIQKLGRERLDQPFDRMAMFLRVVAPIEFAILVERQGIGLFEVNGGPGIPFRASATCAGRMTGRCGLRR